MKGTQRDTQHRENRDRPGYKRPTVPGASRLSDDQLKSVKSLHRLLKDMSFDYTFEECKEALEEYKYNVDVACNKIMDGEFKPWKVENQNTKFGSHQHHR